MIAMTNREAYENMWDELEQYRAIGTVEECREAREKQKPKPPKEANGEYGYYICLLVGTGHM